MDDKPTNPEQEKKDLTIKQRKWLDAYIKIGNATEAAMQVYDCKDRDSANAIGSENLAKLSFVNFLEEMGLSDKKLVDSLNEGLSASKQIGAVILINKNGEVIKQENEGMIEVADYAIRHKYVESILKLKGKFKSADIQVLQQNNYGSDLPIPILGNTPTPDPNENNITFVNFTDVPRNATPQELHQIIKNAQEELKKKKDLQLEDHTDEQLTEILDLDNPIVYTQAQGELKSFNIGSKPQIIEEAQIVPEPEVIEAPTTQVKEEVVPKPPVDPRSLIDQRKAADNMPQIQSPVVERYIPEKDDISSKGWSLE